jgi:chromosome segregation ATPase
MTAADLTSFMIAFAALATVVISLLTDRKKDRRAKEASDKETADQEKRTAIEARRIAELEDANDVTFQKLNTALSLRLERVEAERDDLEKRVRDHEADLDRVRVANAGRINDLERRLAECDRERRELKLELFELQRERRSGE